MSEKIILSPKKILSKQFEVTANGYYPLEVDSMLDNVIEDYASFKRMIENRNEIIDQLRKENEELKAQVEELKQKDIISQSDISKLQAEVSPQVDILKRISALEKAVFGTQSEE